MYIYKYKIYIKHWTYTLMSMFNMYISTHHQLHSQTFDEINAKSLQNLI
jgi:hypothetical protein